MIAKKNSEAVTCLFRNLAVERDLQATDYLLFAVLSPIALSTGVIPTGGQGFWIEHAYVWVTQQVQTSVMRCLLCFTWFWGSLLAHCLIWKAVSHLQVQCRYCKQSGACSLEIVVDCKQACL